ncbi:MAG: hypothetical protein CMJ58_00085 [Planctomycetaceae bacterium]|nr:hypothetical protein [Planctomycetaceae bacterium]
MNAPETPGDKPAARPDPMPTNPMAWTPTAQQLALFDKTAFDERATPEDFQRLEELATEDPRIAAAYLQYVEMASQIEFVLRSRRVEGEVATGAAFRGQSKRQLRTWIGGGLLALAASLALLLARSGERDSGDRQLAADNPAPSAGQNAERSVDAIAGAAVIIDIDSHELIEAGVRVGDHLRSGSTLAFESGRASIEFHEGVVAVIEGPCELSITSISSATLRRGLLAADVPPWAIGFAIDTPQARVIDHGTRFVVDVDASNMVEVAVAEGEVELDGRQPGRDGDEANRRLFAGDGVRLGAAKNRAPLEAGKLVEFARQHLPVVAEQRDMEVIAGYQVDFIAGGKFPEERPGAWRYLVNQNSPIGEPGGYVELQWQEGPNVRDQYDANLAAADEPADSPSGYVALRRDSGHPGLGRFQVDDGIDRYAIAAFTVPADGEYFVRSGWLCRWEEKGRFPDKYLDLVIHVDDRPFDEHKYCYQSGLLKFQADLGPLRRGQTIYVAVGPNGYSYNDSFKWGFKIVRSLSSAINETTTE